MMRNYILYSVLVEAHRTVNVKYKGWDWLKDNAQEQIEEKQRLKDRKSVV